MSANKPSFIELCAESSAGLNKLEVVSIKSLIAYAADQHHADEETVHCIFTTHFEIEDVQSLPQNHYDAAVKFLTDIQLDIILN